MVESGEKSTDDPVAPVNAEIAPGVSLDGRLGLFCEAENWLAVADLHFGYELARRAAGGLWPLWGMTSIENRLEALLEDWKPKTLILVGDIVDNRVAPREAIEWLESVQKICPEVILVRGNHDRGEVLRHFAFVDSYETEGFFFHHGHLGLDCPEGKTEIHGHIHPSFRLNDGAGLALRLPSLVQEKAESEEKWILPAFSPWAGGVKYSPGEDSQYRQWVCSPQRVFEVS